jgi:hypothetical protein
LSASHSALQAAKAEKPMAARIAMTVRARSLPPASDITLPAPTMTRVPSSPTNTHTQNKGAACSGEPYGNRSACRNST